MDLRSNQQVNADARRFALIADYSSRSMDRGMPDSGWRSP